MSSYILGYISKQISWTFEYANWSDNFSRFTHDEGLLYVDQSPEEELTTPQILDFLVKAGRGQIPTRDQPIQDIHELYPQQQVWPLTHFTVRITSVKCVRFVKKIADLLPEGKSTVVFSTIFRQFQANTYRNFELEEDLC